MTQEEKAKAYDEALEKAMKYDPDLVGLSAGEILEDIFPELVESEDEKIRKEIINYLEPQGDCCGNKERWIAWLEKQGEKKPQRMVSAEAKEAGYDRPKQTNWTKNYDWNNGTMTIYNLSKEEHLKVVEFLDCLRHPDVPETDSGEKEPANSARTCKDSQELTEFEKSLYKHIVTICAHSNECDPVKYAKALSYELFSIARKQIASEIDVDAMVSDTIICENLAYYRQGIEDTLKTIKGE